MNRKHKEGYTGKELDALLNSIEGFDEHAYNKKMNFRNGTVIDGEVVIYKSSVDYALRFAAPRYYATEPELTSMFIYELKIKDRWDGNAYFQITVEASELEELNSKTQAILSALNSNK